MTSVTDEEAERRIARYGEDFSRVESALGGVIVGQSSLIHEVLTAIFAGGHVLLEGLPGLGKTHLIKALARATGLDFTRVQCTPDLMPFDILGSEILATSPDGARQQLEFRPGPIFTPVLLVDEINRATPRTQSALLEAMQERQVSHGGRVHPLPSPFWVLATQNPIELEGTYPLPEAQLDRFFFKCAVPYPKREGLVDLLDVSLDDEPADRVEPAVSAGRVREMIDLAREVVVPDSVKRAAADLVIRTQSGDEGAELARRHLRFGASPRALQALIRAARVRALAEGRAHVAVDDVRGVALAALRHRVVLAIESEVEGVSSDEIVQGIIDEWAQQL